MPVAVPREVPGEAEDVAVAGSPDDDGSGDATLQESHAAQDERAHDALTQFRLDDQQRAQLIRRDDQRLNRPTRGGVHQRRSDSRSTTSQVTRSGTAVPA